MVELGWVDINTDISMLASFLDLPREIRLESLLYIYVYLCAKHNKRLALDPSYPEIDESLFFQCYCKELYGDVK